MTFDPTTIRRFTYSGFSLDPERGVLSCDYSLDDVRFTERIRFPNGGRWDDPAVQRAARLVFLFAGVSYYKAAAPPVIDVGTLELTPGESDLLRSFYVDGLGEYALRNDIDLSAIQIVGHTEAAPSPVRRPQLPVRPLVPFGGGIDSIVTVESIRQHTDDITLFVVSRGGDRFDAIEQAATVSGLPVTRAERDLDPKILESHRHGFRNGHVPVTGVLSAIALTAAVLGGHDAVVMSNEWSASMGNVEIDGRVVNHQFSKSLAFERALRRALADNFDGGPDYFSLLRPFSELRIAKRFAGLDTYHHAFRSCNRSFHIERSQRLDRWCGRCDKCCFIDLILAPYVDRATLGDVFDGREPLRDPSLAPAFRALLALDAEPKPFECVGDVDECRVALLATAAKPDRSDDTLVQKLAAELEPMRAALPSEQTLLSPMGEHFIPDAYAPDDLQG